jgi:hypothetical protein
VLHPRCALGSRGQTLSDSPRPVSVAGMHTRRKILAVLAIPGAMAWLAGRPGTATARQLGPLPVREGSEGGALPQSWAAQPTLRTKMLAWSVELDIAKNGKKLVPSVPSPS